MILGYRSEIITQNTEQKTRKMEKMAEKLDTFMMIKGKELIFIKWEFKKKIIEKMENRHYSNR